MSATSSLFLDTADRIGRQLCRDAVWAGSRCNWLGWALVPNNYQWQLAYRAQPATLYDGVAGIALFLGTLVRFTSDKLERATLFGAIGQLRKAIEDFAPSQYLGFHAGLAGVAHVFLETGEALGDGHLTDTGLELLARLREAPLDDHRLDIINGCAGSIPSLLDAAQKFRRDDLMDVAIQMGDHLLRTAVPSERGTSWDTMPENGSLHLLGYAHGASGIACSLLELFAATGNERYQGAAMEGLRYERSHFSPQHRNWPDLRAPFHQVGPNPSGPSYPVAWCHGAPGIGFSRLRIIALANDPKSQTELDIALETTAAALPSALMPGQGNFSLCHGAAGNADLLHTAARELERPELLSQSEAVAQSGIAQYHSNNVPWPCGVPGAGETPNLMLGLAGIGHFYLRLHAPETVRSILFLTTGGTEKARSLTNEKELSHAVGSS
jgi:lantibiotic biosynthesis protein